MNWYRLVDLLEGLAGLTVRYMVRYMVERVVAKFLLIVIIGYTFIVQVVKVVNLKTTIQDMRDS